MKMGARFARAVMASDLDRRVSLQIMGYTRGTMGSAKPTVQSTVTNVAACFLPVKGSEMLRAGQIAADFDARFLFRWRTDLKPKDQIVLDGTTYDIYSIAEIGRRQGLEVMAKARRVG